MTVSQRDNRIYPRREAKYALTRLLVSRIDVKTSRILEYVGDKMDSERDVYVEGQFVKGEYVVYVEADWISDLNRDLVVSVYSEHSTSITEVEAKPELCQEVLD